jgi:hypothetical protein
LTHISEIKNNLGVGTGIVPKIFGFNMQKRDDQHTIWAHALAIYDLFKLKIVDLIFLSYRGHRF